MIRPTRTAFILTGIGLAVTVAAALQPFGARASAAPLRLRAGSAARDSASPAAASTAGGARFRWGFYVPGFPTNLSAVTTVENEVGAPANYVMWYAHWSGPGSVFDVADTQAVINAGATPIVSWISDDAGQSADPFPTPAIAAGQFDAYIRSWAQAIRSVHGTVFLRFDYEMNGNWSAYDAGVQGQSAADYVAAWRHVHDVFASMGVTNVRWVWSPNVVYPGSTPLTLLYPGNQYVDWVGVDGYNWGPSDIYHTWQSFEQVFGPTLAQLQALTPRPLMISEVASGTLGGDKAAWITDMFAQLAAQPSIQAFVWFDANKEEDWRIDSSPQTLAAFRAGLLGS